MKQVTLYTDGACSGNPGPGGWGALLSYGAHEREMSGFCPDTTNNRMELTAAIEGLRALNEPCAVDLYTDSRYVEQAITAGWLAGWKRKGWRKSDGKPVLNPELWQQLDEQLGRHRVTLHWVKGHAENPGNNRCDALATGAIKNRRGGL